MEAAPPSSPLVVHTMTLTLGTWGFISSAVPEGGDLEGKVTEVDGSEPGSGKQQKYGDLLSLKVIRTG